jgi:hypothetical protein
MTDFELLLCGIKYGSFCHFKCTITWLGILCSNTPFPVFEIGFISRFSALMAFDFNDIGLFCPEIFDLDPDKSRDRFDFMQALVALVPVCIHVATKLFVKWRWEWLILEIGFEIGFGAKRIKPWDLTFVTLKWRGLGCKLVHATICPKGFLIP